MNRRFFASGLVLLVIAMIGVAGTVRANTLVNEYQRSFDKNISKAEQALREARDAEGEKKLQTAA